MIVAFCAGSPRRFILFTLTVLFAVRWPPAPQWVGELRRWVDAMKPWSMNEVMILGILVALMKIAELATVEPGMGMFAIFGLMVLFPVDRLDSTREDWRRIEWADGELPHTPPEPPEAMP